MQVTHIRRLVNPRRAKNASARRRKMSPKQIRHFGTTRQKAALKAARTRKRTASATHRAAPRRKTTRAANPAHLFILGNPHTSAPKKRKRTNKRSNGKMAATRKQLAALRKARAARKRSAVANPRHRKTANPHRHHVLARARNSRKRNSTKVYVIRKNSRRGAARRNPEMFGMSGSSAGKAILAGLVGVYATKTVTPMVANIAPQIASSNIMAALVSGIVAWGGGFLVAKWDKTAGAGFMFGGLMQAGSQLLNSIVPTNPLSLSGLGDFAPGGPVGLFPVMNPIRAAAMARAQGMLPPPTGAPQNNLAGMDAARMFL